MATKSSTPPPLATAEVAAVLAEAATVEDSAKAVEIRDREIRFSRAWAAHSMIEMGANFFVRQHVQIKSE